MASSHREVESKYEAPTHGGLPDLCRLPGVASVDVAPAQKLEAAYFDTSDLTLLAAGITVRRRTGGEDDGWHVKVPSPPGRHELHQPLGRAIKTVPASVRTLLLAHVRRRPLAPVATVSTTRTVHRLQDDQGRVLAEVCDDRVTSRATRGDRLERRWHEWEVELVDVGDDLLRAAAALLGEAGATPAQSASKLARALGDPAGPQPSAPKMSRGRPASRMVQARIAEQLVELKRQDPLARADVADGVHKLRVAMRRLRSALATFRPLLDREVSDPIRDELKWVASELGKARDAEVAQNRLTELADLEPGLVDDNLADQAGGELEHRHVLAHQAALEALQSGRYLALLDALDRLVADPPWTDSAGRPTKKVLPARVRHDWRRVKRRVRDVEKAEASGDTAAVNERLHAVRKAARRTRYAAETLEPVYGKHAKAFAKAMKKVQRTLGEHHDAILFQEQLRDIAAHQDDSQAAFMSGRLYAHEGERAARARTDYDDALEAASRKKLRRWLD